VYTKATYGTAAGEGAVFVVTGSSSRVRAPTDQLAILFEKR
jgi:hypothetical protein